MEVLYGLHPVEEALKAGRRRFEQVLVARERHDERLESLVALCREAGVRVRQEARDQLTQLAQTPAHQGVVAMVRPQEFLTIEDLYEPLNPGATACCWLWMAWKTRRIWALCCAWPMEPEWTECCLPSGVLRR